MKFKASLFFCGTFFFSLFLSFALTAAEEIEGLALCDTDLVGDVDEDDVSQFLGGGPVGAGCADIAGSDDADLGTWHGYWFLGRGYVRG